MKLNTILNEAKPETLNESFSESDIEVMKKALMRRDADIGDVDTDDAEEGIVIIQVRYDNPANAPTIAVVKQRLRALKLKRVRRERSDMNREVFIYYFDRGTDSAAS